jgi:membrane protease YdiL (CAAX protease family)
MRALKSIAAFILYFVVAIGVQWVIQWAVFKSGVWKPANGFSALDFIISDGTGIIAVTIVAWIAAMIEKRRVTDYGLPPKRSAVPHVVEGFIWGTVAPVLTAVLVIACGGATYAGLALHGDALLRAAAFWLLAMMVLGFYEEWAFRGYPLNVLARGIGFWPAALVNAIGFGALHYFTKPMENIADFAAVSLITLFMCLTIFRTGALWFAIGFHAAFDYFALIVLAAPNTGNNGLPIPGHLLDIRYTGAAWLTGGPRGLEASAPMFLVMALFFAAYLIRTKSSTRSPASS